MCYFQFSIHWLMWLLHISRGVTNTDKKMPPVMAIIAVNALKSTFSWSILPAQSDRPTLGFVQALGTAEYILYNDINSWVLHPIKCPDVSPAQWEKTHILSQTVHGCTWFGVTHVSVYCRIIESYKTGMTAYCRYVNFDQQLYKCIALHTTYSCAFTA